MVTIKTEPINLGNIFVVLQNLQTAHDLTFTTDVKTIKESQQVEVCFYLKDDDGSQAPFFLLAHKLGSIKLAVEI